QDYTLATLLLKLERRHETNRGPLGEIQFNFEHLAEKAEWTGLTTEVEPNPKAFVKADLFLNIIESEDGLRLDCDYNTDLYDGTTSERWLECYESILEAIAGDMEQKLLALRCMPSALRQRLEQFHGPEADYPRGACVQQLF